MSKGRQHAENRLYFELAIVRPTCYLGVCHYHDRGVVIFIGFEGFRQTCSDYLYHLYYNLDPL